MTFSNPGQSQVMAGNGHNTTKVSRLYRVDQISSGGQNITSHSKTRKDHVTGTGLFPKFASNMNINKGRLDN